MTTNATEAPASEEWLKLDLAIDDYPPLAETLRRQAALSDSRPIQAAIAAAAARKERAEAARAQFDLDAAVGVASSAGDTRANEAVIVDADLEIRDLQRTLAVRRSALDVLNVAIGRYRGEAITAYFASKMPEYGEAVRRFNEALHAAAAANKEMSAIWKTVEDCPPPWPPPWRGVFEIRDEFLYNYEPCDSANCSRLELHLSQCHRAGFDSEAPE